MKLLITLTALNWAPPDCSTPPYDTQWQIKRIDDAFTVAAAQNFKLVYSFDMAYIDEYCAYGWNQTFMASMIMKYAPSKALLRWKGDILVTTYAGEGYGDSFLSGLKTLMDGKGTHILLAPALTTYADQVQEANDTYISEVADTMLNDWQSIDGYLNCESVDLGGAERCALIIMFRASLAVERQIQPYRRCGYAFQGRLQQSLEAWPLYHG